MVTGRSLDHTPSTGTLLLPEDDALAGPAFHGRGRTLLELEGFLRRTPCPPQLALALLSEGLAALIEGRPFDGAPHRIELAENGSAVFLPEGVEDDAFEPPEGGDGPARTIYRLASSAYFLLSGHAPYGTDAVRARYRSLTSRPRYLATLRDDLPLPVVGMIHKMMEKRPHRPTDPEVLKIELEQLAARLEPAADAEDTFLGALSCRAQAWHEEKTLSDLDQNDDSFQTADQIDSWNSSERVGHRVSTRFVAANLGALRLIDLRAPDDFASGRILGAESKTPAEVLREAKMIAQGGAVVLVCATGTVSLDLVQKLWVLGERSIAALRGGMEVWNREGRPTLIQGAAIQRALERQEHE